MNLPHQRGRAALVTCLDAVILVTASVAAAIAFGGGGRFTIAGTRIVMVSVGNPLAIAAGAALLRALVGWRLPPFPAGIDKRLSTALAAERERIARPAPVPRAFPWYAAGVALVALMAVAPHVLHPRSVPDPGDPLFSAWRLAVFEHQLTHDPRHLFDGNTFYPAHWTLTYSDATVLQGIVAAPFIAAGVDPLLVSNWLFLAAFPLSALTFFYSSWRLTSDLRAGFVAGILVALYPSHT